jgi:choline dehydrogenase-like flavoprotein
LHDCLIIGAGLCGAWTAKLLAEAGVSALVLEAGPELGPEALLPAPDEGQRWQAAPRQPIQSRHPAYRTHNPSLFVDDIEHPYRSCGDEPFVWIRGRQVGGRGLTWGGVTLRFSDYEFRAATRDGFGADWPLTHSDLAPFFDEVESFFGVSGTNEALAQLPDGVFLPSPPLTEAEARFKDEVESRWNDRRVTACRGILRESSVYPVGDAAWPRRSPQNRMLPDAQRTGRVTIKSNSVVSRLNMDRSGRRVVSVSCVDRRTRSVFEIPCRAVALCASTLESVRILLNSKCKEHPRGVGNSSDCLGRYLLDHAASVSAGYIPERPHSIDHPFGGPDGIIVPRFRNVREARSDFIRGYGLWGGLGRGRWPNGSEMWTLCAMLEVLPRADNRIEIDDESVDSCGVATPVIKMSYTRNERRMLEDAERCVAEMAGAVGLRVERQVRMAPGTFVHELGGARMGTSPDSSVLDRCNRCWDADNLFVLDGACFVTSGWQNPTLTMLALAGRACRGLAEHLERGDL